MCFIKKLGSLAFWHKRLPLSLKYNFMRFKQIFQISTVALLFILVNSCSIQKRHYTNGYFVDWKKSNKKTDSDNKKTNKGSENEFIELSNSNNSDYLIASNADLPVFNNSEKSLFLNNNFAIFKNKHQQGSSKIDSSDVIMLKSGVEIKCKLLEINQNDIKYIDFSNLNGPTYTIPKSDVFFIKYSNGTKEIINAIENKKPASNSSSAKGKSQIIALVLCILVGVLGIHRFYLGHIGIGIAQLLTLGGCGIWTLIDLIMIITGDLKPKDGDYDEKL